MTLSFEESSAMKEILAWSIFVAEPINASDISWTRAKLPFSSRYSPTAVSTSLKCGSAFSPLALVWRPPISPADGRALE